MSVTFQGDEGSGFGLIDPLKKQIAALAAENEGLRSALEAVANWACLLSDDALGNYERVADEFYRETRHMRPGKDDARHYHTDEERTARWNNWCEVKRMAITVRVREALSRKAAP